MNIPEHKDLADILWQLFNDRSNSVIVLTFYDDRFRGLAIAYFYFWLYFQLKQILDIQSRRVSTISRIPGKEAIANNRQEPGPSIFAALFVEIAECP